MSDDQTATTIVCTECLSPIPFDKWAMLNDPNEMLHAKIKEHMDAYHPDCEYSLQYRYSGTQDRIKEVNVRVLHPTEDLEPDNDSKFDPVDHPRHYDKNGVECIDWIRMCLTPEEFRGYLKGNSLKYLWRNEHKGNPVQDLGKAGWYVDKLRAFSNSDTSKEG